MLADAVRLGEGAQVTMEQANLAAALLTHHQLHGDPRFQPASDDPGDLEGVEVIRGRLYRFPQYDRNLPDADTTLTVYFGLGDLGGQLWEQEARALNRIGSSGHPSLPEFCGSGQVEAGAVWNGAALTDGIGYIRTRSVGRTADLGAGAVVDGGVDFTDQMRAQPAEALRQLWLLSDALSVLHDARMFHRNLWPGTIEVGAAQDGALRIALSRFEMSQMVASLVGVNSGRTSASALRGLYLEQHPRWMLYAAPELINFVGGGLDELQAPSWQSDVFALGMMAAQWFLDEPVPEPKTIDAASTGAWHEEVRRAVRTQLPRSLRALIGSMIHSSASQREEAARVANLLETNFETMRGELVGDLEQAPHVVAYLLQESDTTLLTWGFLAESASTPAGREQLEALIERDMKNAQVVVSPNGASGFVPSDGSTVAEMETAKTVIFGRELVWFCSVLTRHTPSGPERVPYARVVRWVLRRPQVEFMPRLDDLRTQGARRTVFAVRAIDGRSTSDRVFRRLAPTAPSWDELERGQDRTRAISARAESYLNALKWYLDYQQAELGARTFAYRLDTSALGSAELRRDAERENRRRHGGTAVAAKLAGQPDLRRKMSDHFEEAAEAAGGAVEIEVFADHAGRPGERSGTCRFARIRGREAIEVTTVPGTVLPAIGWIRLRSDKAEQHSIRQQTLAVADLAQRRPLVQQLVDPTVGTTLAARWVAAGGGLLGEGREAVQRILMHESLFALQGPPGTGKTEVTSQAVADYLRANPGARILVSAQSHDALDNLAMRVLRKLDAINADGRPLLTDLVALRAASEATKGRIADQLKPFDLAAFTRRLVENAEARAREWLTTRRVEDPALARVLETWLESAHDTILELEARTRRGANLVFATTGASTRDRLVDEYGAAEPFDWVVVEEAAKAWPTELALPLVHGLRWTLVGDQAQIGAFNRQRVERFLMACENDPNPEVADWFERRDDLLRAFDTFGNLFALEGARPRMELTEQYRMHSRIADVVSGGFYSDRAGGGLRTMVPDRDHGLVEPGWLRGQSLVWIDTEGEQRAEPYWSNEYEAAVVARLVRSMEPSSDQPGSPSLAVLTPYRKQVEVLSGALGEYASSVFTIDAFQGREADIVVASLVRDHDPPRNQPYPAVGHLGEAARANVMLSRARTLMIVVGRLPIYGNTGLEHWDRVVAAFLDHGLVVPASAVLA